MLLLPTLILRNASGFEVTAASIYVKRTWKNHLNLSLRRFFCIVAYGSARAAMGSLCMTMTRWGVHCRETVMNMDHTLQRKRTVLGVP